MNTDPASPEAAVTEDLHWVHDLSWDGRGVARTRDGRVLMIFGAIPGDTVRVRIEREHRNGVIDAKIAEIVEESPQRVPHPCPHYAKGCPASQLGAVRREFSLEWKRNHLVETLRRIGGLEGVVVEPVIHSPKQWRYRERLEFHVERTGDGLDIGYIGLQGLVPIRDCRLGEVIVREPLLALRRNLYLLDPHPHLGARVQLRLLLRDNGRGQAIAVLFVLTKGPVDSQPLEGWLDTAGFAGWEIRRAQNARLRNIKSELMITKGDPSVHLMINGRPLTLGSTVFSQVNRMAAGAMVEVILEQLPERGRLLDLYGGFGSFALEYAFHGGSAVVVDSAPEAIQAGRDFLAENKKLKVELVERDLGREGVDDLEPREFDTVLLDPPHAGADEHLLKALNDNGPGQIIYVSCHPAALARDIKSLTKYEVELVIPVDMFPSTSELETVVILERKNQS